MPGLKDLPPPPPGKQGWPWTEATPSAPEVAPDGGRWPRFTIVTPSFNQAAFLEETLRSILLQGYPELELIVMDGGSQDGSVEVIRKYERFLSFWVSQKDRGQTDALNQGFARGSGQLRGFLNSDDLYEPGALQTVAKEFTAGADWVSGRCRFIEEGRQPWLDQVPGRETDLDWLTNDPLPQPSVFWSDRLHQVAGEFRLDLHYSFDWEFWLRFRFKAGAKVRSLAPVLSSYRLHKSSKTVAFGAKFLDEGRRIRAMYSHRLLPAEQRQLKRRVARIESLFWQDEAWRLFPLSRPAAWRTLLRSLACAPGNAAAWRLGLYFGLPDRCLGLLRRAGLW